MRSLLVLRNIKVENANAIAGLTYGFPAISNFLGFTHSLSRDLQKKFKVSLGGCAVVCHQHHVNVHQPAGWGDYVFALTRNPLTKESATPAFVEEGRMQMEVSLLVECDFDIDDLDFGTGNADQDTGRFEDYVQNKALMHRLAGGTIQSIGKVLFTELPQDSDALAKFNRRQLLKLLPGFILMDRSDLLKKHYETLLAENPEAELIDAWLDFSALKYAARPDPNEDEDPTEQTKATWEHVAKPGDGWLVPITTGFKAISPLYENGEVARSRDPHTPFRFVESAYGIGEWLSPHRIVSLEQIFWRYKTDGDWYLCENRDHSQPEEITTPPAQQGK
jgi:CRISPR-associated protein Csy2